MAKAEIYIWSATVGSGKTTILSDWLQNKSAGGILTPKIDGVRYFLDLNTQEKFRMDAEEGIVVGRHIFDEEAFRKAEKILENEILSDRKYLVIDEIGPLEIRKEQGFHHIISRILSANYAERKSVIVIVRDFMAAEFVQKYRVNHAKLLPLNFLENSTEELEHLDLPVGIVLAGGESSRMNADKALLSYHGKPQFLHVAEMLEKLCEKTVISIRENQEITVGETAAGFDLLRDDPASSGNGPMTGLLTAVKNFPGKTLLLAAVDYPLLELQHLILLNNHRTADFEAVCYEKDGFVEPLITVLESSAVTKLEAFYRSGNSSLSKFLKSIKLKTVDVGDADFLLNVNTPEELAIFTERTASQKPENDTGKKNS